MGKRVSAPCISFFSCLILSVLCMCLVQPVLVDAGSRFYRYVDQDGRVRYTDNPANIPADQLQNMDSDATYKNEAGIMQDIDEPAEQRIVVNYDASGGTIFVSAVLDRHYPAVFHLDTGASSSMITESDVQHLGVSFEPGRSIRGLIADGSIVEMPVVRLGSIGLGEAVVEDIEVAVGKMRLLGMDFLENFELSINSQAGQLVLVAKDPGWGHNASDPEPESYAARQDRQQAQQTIGSQIQQLTLMIKTRQGTIEQHRSDINDAELQRAAAETTLNTIREQTRFEGSGISRSSSKASTIKRIEKNILDIGLFIQNRQDNIMLQQEQIASMQRQIKHLRSLRDRMD